MFLLHGQMQRRFNISGIAVDVEERLKKHNTGTGAKYTALIAPLF